MEDGFLQQDNFVKPDDRFSAPQNEKKGLGIAATVLGIISILCCCCLGVGFIFSIIGFIFSIVCLVKGTGSGKTFGIVGLILNGIGLLMGLYLIISVAMMLNWENFTIETFNQLEYIDPNDDEAIYNWLQQLFKVDISGYYY